MENMSMAVKEETKKDFVKKGKKQKKDKSPEFKVESKIKTEKMLGELSENNVMKKKKRKIATEDVDPKAEEVYKKKKKLVKTNRQTETADLLLVEPVKDKKKKKIKNKSMQTESNVEIVKTEKEEHNDIDNLQEEKNKSKKAKKVKQIVVMEAQTIKKKDKKTKTQSLDEEEDVIIIESVTTKKKKKSKAEKEVKIEGSESDQIENVKIKKKGTKDKEITHTIKENYSNSAKEEMEEKDSIQLKKKHKKTKCEREMDMVVDSKKIKKAQDILSVTDEIEPKKKKKKTTPEENDKGSLLLDSESDSMSKVKQKKCSKKREKEIETEVDGVPKKRKKRIKEEQLDPKEHSQVEVVFLSEKTGNTDEVNINKERRQALQMEIDQASQPQKPAKPSGLGQWGSAEFGSSEQQQKFLRLMGGFKKGLQPASSSGGGGNMALGREAQKQLQQGLMGEFDRAHSRRMDSSNRGAGLGFTAPSKNKFTIDANMTRSIRFDD